MKKLLVIGVAMVFFGIVSLASVHAQDDSFNRVIRVKSQESMYNRTHVVAALFMNAHPNIKVVVERVPLVDDAISALIDKLTDVAMASRRLTEQEDQAALAKAIKLQERLIGYGGIVIITHSKNPVNELTIAQVKQLLKGEIKNWKELGGANEPVTVIKTGEAFPGTRVFIEQELLDKAPITSDAVVVAHFHQAMLKVAQTRGAVGYVRIRDAFESNVSKEAKIKTFKIKQSQAIAGVMPSRATVADATYPLRRPYYLYTQEEINQDLKSYVDFVLQKGWGSEQ